MRYRLTIMLVVTAPVLLVGVMALGAWALLFRDGDDRPPGARDYITGLPAPVGLSLGLGGLVITSLGEGENSGAVYRASIEGDRARGDAVSKLVEGLPSRRAGAGVPPFLATLGPTAAVDEGQSIAVVVSGSGKPFGVLYRAPLQAGAPSGDIADLGAYALSSSARPPAASPFAAVRDGNGDLYVSDPLAGLVLKVTPKGELSVFAEFGSVQPPDDQPFAALPAGLVIGPGGALYVTLFSGDPYRSQRSRIYRLQDRNADGDANDPGERTLAAGALSFCIAVAFGADGSLYALEYAGSMDSANKLAPGRLWRLRADRAELIADDLVTPTSLVIDGRGRAFIAERDTGKVRMLPDVDAVPGVQR